jgi:hypothetical protein
MNTCISHPEELENNNANTLSGEERLRDEKTGITEVTFWPTVCRMYAASRYKQKYNLTVVMGTPVYYTMVSNSAEDVFSRLQHRNYQMQHLRNSHVSEIRHVHLDKVRSLIHPC